MTNPSKDIIFFGNGPLADHVISTLEAHHCRIVFHARTRDDLPEVIRLKSSHPEYYGVLASFGVLIKSDLLDLFATTGGILNIHPSLLPDLRGASPIESAILRGDTSFSVSIMQLVRAMDAGPIYYQTTLSDLPLDKSLIYEHLATAGASWLADHLDHLPAPTPQDDSAATFCGKFDKSISLLTPSTKPASVLYREIIAFAGFPKSKFTFFGRECIIHAAHVSSARPEAKSLFLECSDHNFLVIDRLQPAGKNPMDTASFLNGYAK